MREIKQKLVVKRGTRKEKQKVRSGRWKMGTSDTETSRDYKAKAERK